MCIIGGAGAKPILGREQRLLPVFVFLKQEKISIAGLFVTARPVIFAEYIIEAGKKSNIFLFDPPGLAAHKIDQKIIIKLLLLK